MKVIFEEAKWQTDSSGTWLCFLTTVQAAREALATVPPGKKYVLETKQHREKRSLSANAYYWVLLTKLAGALHISNNAAHNMMLRRYGQPETLDGKLAYIILPETEESERLAMESETYHLKPTTHLREGKDGHMYRTYFLLKGSHTYDSKEMATLIDGLVSECRLQGIETLTPEELQRLEGYGAQADKGA